MTAQEKSRHELYTGLSHVLGPELTDKLMSYLPTSPGTEVATKGDFAELRTDLKDLAARVDKLQIVLIGGFLATLTTVIAASVWS